ncbi:MAG: MBL fold metallo-hydrolase, partial [Verrucomicrobiota bacterium]
MKITILGAAGGEVTGSAYLVETAQTRLLVDCGLFQGSRNGGDLNHAPFGAAVLPLAAVLLTHAHLDHTGRLPLLAPAGYAGPVFATPATIDMTALILRDSAKVQMQDAERANRHLAPGEEPAIPLYTLSDVEQLLPHLRAVPYHDPVAVAPGVQARFVEAGHMLGSASIQLLIEENGVRRTVVFSGDLGPRGAPILRDAEPFAQADLVFLESTYGDRDHRPIAATIAELIAILQQAVTRPGRGDFPEETAPTLPRVPRQPDGDRGLAHPRPPPGVVRRGDDRISAGPADRAGSRHDAMDGDGGRIEGDQRPPRPWNRHCLQ